MSYALNNYAYKILTDHEHGQITKTLIPKHVYGVFYTVTEHYSALVQHNNH